MIILASVSRLLKDVNIGYLILLQMKAIGMLELNVNNNDEILRESSAQRKAQFLRSLTKQYL